MRHSPQVPHAVRMNLVRIRDDPLSSPQIEGDEMNPADQDSARFGEEVHNSVERRKLREQAGRAAEHRYQERDVQRCEYDGSVLDDRLGVLPAREEDEAEPRGQHQVHEREERCVADGVHAGDYQRHKRERRRGLGGGQRQARPNHAKHGLWVAHGSVRIGQRRDRDEEDENPNHRHACTARAMGDSMCGSTTGSSTGSLASAATHSSTQGSTAGRRSTRATARRPQLVAA
mmetsp:Transcript_40805/g.100743  ORF Transcript_40805/g.100743 Transcript_40805/m.100743 type:complete len:231 (+) Transcript_40805:463-1155(+)